MAETAEEVRKHLKLYLFIGGALFAFTIITVLVSYVDFGNHSLNIGVGLLIAAFKASLVALIFMHLKGEKPMIYKFLVFTAIFVLGMFVLILLQHADPLVFEGFLRDGS